MSMILQHRWEHALVAAVVDSAKRNHPSGFLGRTAIQKLIYFLKVLDVPMSYQFRIHHFGPYCEDLVGSLDWLQADDVVVDESNQSKYSNFSVGTNWDALKNEYQPQLAQYNPQIESVAEVLGFMSPADLELLATLHYSFRWVHAQGGNGPWKPKAIMKFKEIKKDKFDDQIISDGYDRLARAKLVSE